MKVVDLNRYRYRLRDYWKAIGKIELSLDLLETGRLKAVYLEISLHNLDLVGDRFFDNILDLVDLPWSPYLGFRTKGKSLALLLSRSKMLIDRFEELSDGIDEADYYRRIDEIVG